jgi:hypothetical protein
MLEHGASADRYLETTGRSISEYVVDEVDDRRVGRSWRMRCHGAARTSRLALDCPHLAGA